MAQPIDFTRVLPLFFIKKNVACEPYFKKVLIILFNQSLKMSFVKHKVIEIAKRLGAYNENIVYGLEDENTFDIKFNERTDRISLNSMICKSFWFWPTIAANGWIYSCAHKANENSEHLNVHLEELKDYYNCIRKRTQEKMEFSCDTPQLCPSNLNYINSLFF